MNKTWKLAAALLLAVAALAACTPSSKESRRSSGVQQDEQGDISDGFDRMGDSQQIPVFDYSQERQTLIDVETIRAEGTHGTAYVTALDGTLLWWCPTVGAPVPSTYQVSNPSAFVDPPDRGGQTDVLVPQGEPTGVYPGESQATWILCLDDQGSPFAQYDEAQVRWTSGVVNGLPDDKRARVDEITFEFTEAPEG